MLLLFVNSYSRKLHAPTGPLQRGIARRLELRTTLTVNTVEQTASPGTSVLVRTFMTIREAYREIDWNKHALTGFVVIDPLNPSVLQYLDEGSYRSLQRVCLSKDKQLIVVATPESTPEREGSTNNSPFSPLRGFTRVRASTLR